MPLPQNSRTFASQQGGLSTDSFSSFDYADTLVERDHYERENIQTSTSSGRSTGKRHYFESSLLGKGVCVITYSSGIHDLEHFYKVAA